MVHLKANQYLDNVRRSGLVDESRLGKLLASFHDLEHTDSGIICSTLIETGLLTKWQSAKLMEGKSKGFFLGKYKLLGRLGKGAMGSIYLAEHSTLKRRVAIKVMQKELVGLASFLERFYIEAQAAAALDHPNIVRCYDADEADDTHYFVMEYVDGDTLQELVDRSGPLEYRLAVDYTRQAALGLEHAHNAGIVHRDVKPANLLVNGAGVVKVLDLGLARVQDDARASLTVAYDERMIGTVDYLAPEQAIDCHAVDARADIYSLGCTLYFLLSGRPPFAEGTMAQRVMKHQKSQPPPLRLVRADIPGSLEAICQRMMAKQPRDRPPSAAELAQALTEWLEPATRTTPILSTPSANAPIAARASTAEKRELRLASDSVLENPRTKRPKLAPQPSAASTSVEIDLSEASSCQPLNGLAGLLDEVLHEPPKLGSPLMGTLLDGAHGSTWSAPAPSPWTNPARQLAAIDEPEQARTIPLWLLIGAGILMGIIVLLVAYSAISSFVLKRPPPTVEDRRVD